MFASGSGSNGEPCTVLRYMAKSPDGVKVGPFADYVEAKAVALANAGGWSVLTERIAC